MRLSLKSWLVTYVYYIEIFFLLIQVSQVSNTLQLKDLQTFNQPQIMMDSSSKFQEGRHEGGHV
jgi:hypothetical protein